MNLEQLRGFLTIVRLENLSKAAVELGISQPALSRSIHRLEDELGQPLFNRQSRAMALTDAGERFVDAARTVVMILDQAKAESADEPGRGRVSVGAIPTIAPFFLPAFLHQFAGEFPQAEVVVTEDTTDRLLEGLKRGTVDIAIAALPIDEPHLKAEWLLDESLYAVLPRKHPLAAKGRVTLDDVRDQPIVLLNEAHCLAEAISGFCKQKSLQPIVVDRVNQLAMVQELVALSHGISFVPDMARRRDHASTRAYAPIADEHLHRSIVAVHNPYRFQSRIMQQFLDRLRTYARHFDQDP